MIINVINNYCFQSNEEQEFEQFVSGFLNPDSGKLVKPAPGKIKFFFVLICIYFNIFLNMTNYRDLC